MSLYNFLYHGLKNADRLFFFLSLLHAPCSSMAGNKSWQIHGAVSTHTTLGKRVTLAQAGAHAPAPRSMLPAAPHDGDPATTTSATAPSMRSCAPPAAHTPLCARKFKHVFFKHAFSLPSLQVEAFGSSAQRAAAAHPAHTAQAAHRGRPNANTYFRLGLTG